MAHSTAPFSKMQRNWHSCCSSEKRKLLENISLSGDFNQKTFLTEDIQGFSGRSFADSKFLRNFSFGEKLTGNVQTVVDLLTQLFQDCTCHRNFFLR